ncbi:glutamate--tRNA ligase [Fulvivirgaceae bacterium PWU4]|uniref:Glutamate--tRNA ligase n=1 Tax=Chryseosolibacter histidini TaxID=2782349 RepID=A0AAP2DSS6_9BACT|nr:glutamate--tRNA ligase [Chryseosolibacter histidini]MBT1700392.1 glutamate--tRNA ligase [Chryseosolibacter histidini]
MREVRVRFAPSPTGALHIGGVRTALYNYLLARQQKGTMILRIEDTDQTRYVPGAEQYILDSLKWVGITIDEGVGVGGPHAPYRQSERQSIYKQYAQQLIDSGQGYYAFDTAEELEQMREKLKAGGVDTPQYNSITRTQMRNSLTLPAEEVKRLIDSGAPYVIRLKVPRKEEVRLNDLIRGWVSVHSSQIDDKVLMKSDGMPTYHLANVVDDYLMKISHVIRGEEWLPSAPLHVLLYRAFGWENDMPQFAHLPLLLKPDGNGKLSKRDADQLGFPIFPLTWKDPHTQEVAKGYREAGYLPEALLNFLAFLGWNPGTTQELFSVEELTQAFSIERIGKAGAKFDIHKAQWFNQQYLRAKSDEELAEFLLQSLQKENISCSKEKAVKIAAVMKERVTFPQDFWEQGKYFFHAPAEYDQGVVAKKWNEEAVKVLLAFKDEVSTLSTVDAATAKASLEKVTAALNIGTGKILQALRVSLTGAGGGPDLMMIMEIIGKQEIVQRIEGAVKTLKVKVA